MSGARRSADESPTRYELILFVAGDGPNSQVAQRNLAELCEEELEGRCEVEIVDVIEQFEVAVEHGVLVTPTLRVVKPGPPVVLVGNLSNRQRVRRALRLAHE